MRSLKKVRKLSRDNFVESYGVMSRSKSVDGRANKPRSAKSQSTEMYGTFRRRKNSHSSVEENDQIQNERGRVGYEDSNKNNNNNNANNSTSEDPSTDIKFTVGEETPTLQAQSEVQYKGPANRRLRRFSLKKFPSTGDIHKAVSRKTKSDGTDDQLKEVSGGTEKSAEAPGRIASWQAQLSINKRMKTPSTPLGSKSPRRTLFRIPALGMSPAAQSGYLDRRNRKKKWEKLWCVLQDSCLYCYISPQSEFTQDATVLPGYIVSADMSDVQRAKFTFKLEKKGAPTYHFRCDNHKGFMSWICMIKKESTQSVPDVSDNEILFNGVKNSTQPPSRALSDTSMHPPPVSSNNRPMLSRRHTADNIFRMTRREHLDLELQKENLLREVLEQQKEIIKERNSIMASPKQTRPYYVPLVRDIDSPKPTKNEVMEKYERVKENQQMKILKSLTQLHRRRNSVQLKVDQLSRETRPKTRLSGTTSRYVIQSMEARLALLQSEQAEIDQEIREQLTNKEDIMDNINHKRDLEIMVLDQQECLDIVKRNQPAPARYQERGRCPARRQASVPVSYMHEHLTSIDEISTICQSDASSVSSGLSNSCSELNSACTLQAISSTPRYRARMSLEIIPDPEEGEKIDSVTPDDCFRSCQSIATSKSSSCSSDGDEVLSVEGALSDDFRSLSTSSYSDLDAECRTRVSSSDESLGKKSSEIRPDVLAEIEEFEVFSKMMLQRISSSQCT